MHLRTYMCRKFFVCFDSSSNLLKLVGIFQLHSVYYLNKTMPGTRCAVAGCNNSHAKTKHLSQVLSHFSFPKCADLRKIWVDRCKRKDSFNPSTSHVCSTHFLDSDFIRNLKAELLGER